MLRKNFFSDEQLIGMVKDYRTSCLEPAEVALFSFVEKSILHQHNITKQDVDELKNHDYSDEEILDIVLAASARSFYTKVLDSLGAEPDDVYLELSPELRVVLTKGRKVNQPSDGEWSI